MTGSPRPTTLHWQSARALDSGHGEKHQDSDGPGAEEEHRRGTFCPMCRADSGATLGRAESPSDPSVVGEGGEASGRSILWRGAFAAVRKYQQPDPGQGCYAAVDRPLCLARHEATGQDIDTL